MEKFCSFILLTFLLFSCSGHKLSDHLTEEINVLKSELDSLKTANQLENQIATFFTFQKGDAESAMNFYMDLFENSKIVQIKRWGKEGPGKEGSVMHGTFTLNGKLYMCSDSPAIHEWGFTPAVSNFVECSNEKEIEDLFNKLSENGKVMMPLNNYGFSQKFGFVEDQFGISWQVNLQ